MAGPRSRSVSASRVSRVGAVERGGARAGRRNTPVSTRQTGSGRRRSANGNETAWNATKRQLQEATGTTGQHEGHAAPPRSERPRRTSGSPRSCGDDRLSAAARQGRSWGRSRYGRPAGTDFRLHAGEELLCRAQLWAAWAGRTPRMVCAQAAVDHVHVAPVEQTPERETPTVGLLSEKRGGCGPRTRPDTARIGSLISMRRTGRRGPFGHATSLIFTSRGKWYRISDSNR